MAHITTVDVTNGVPTAGTGTVYTIDALMALIGEVQASPTSNTALDRLKALLTGITLASGAIQSGAVASGAVASGAIASGAVASGAVASGAFASGALASGSVADGAMVTVGAKADAKSTATDTTAITLMQVAKQISASVQSLVTALGSSALSLNTGAAAATTLRVALADVGVGEYETVAASQTAQVLGATGATGDYISGVLVIPATTSPGNVLLLDNATSITVFTGGATSVSNLVPFFIPLGMYSVSGAWKLTTGANVSCIGIGNFL